MIIPDKFTDPYNCIYYNSYVILNILKNKSRINSKMLYEKYIEKLGKEAEVLFLPSLDFLYLIGKVDYHDKNDELELKS